MTILSSQNSLLDIVGFLAGDGLLPLLIIVYAILELILNRNGSPEIRIIKEQLESMNKILERLIAEIN